MSRTAKACLDSMASLHASKLNAAPTCSVGISLFPQDGHDMNKLYYMADQALYESKGLGKKSLYLLRIGQNGGRKVFQRQQGMDIG